MFELLDGRPSAYQWDTGLYVDCTGLAESDEVHFCRPGITLALHPAMQGETLAARVPDELLQQAQPIIVFAYVQTAAGTGEITKVSARLCVTARPKPPGYIASPTEALRWATLQEQIGDLADLNTQDKTNLVAAVNEAMTQGGAADPEAVQQIVEDYLAENPPTVTETDPTVPEWAKQETKPTYTANEVGAISQDDLQAVTNEALAQAKASGEFDGPQGPQGPEGTQGPKGDTGPQGPQGETGPAGADGRDGADGQPGADGKSAYQYAQDGGYTGTESEFAAKMAEEMPDKLPNPNALTFSGAVTGSYDGSAPVSVEIPSGGGGSGGDVSWKLIRTINIVSGTSSYDVDTDNHGNAFKVKNFLILIDAYPAGGYLEIKPNNNLSFLQKATGKQNYPFSFMMKRLSDARYILENSTTYKSTFERIISKEYSHFGEFTSFGFWFAAPPDSDTTMYILGEDV